MLYWINPSCGFYEASCCLKEALKTFYKQQSKLILFQYNVYSRSFVPRKFASANTKPDFYCSHDGQQKRLGWVFEYFWRVTIKRSWFSLFWVFEEDRISISSFECASFYMRNNNLLLVIFLWSWKIQVGTTKRVSVCLLAAWFHFWVHCKDSLKYSKF